MFRATLRRYAAPGFWTRTNQEFQRQAKFTINLEALTITTIPQPLLDFEEPQTATWMKMMTDQTVGGFSEAKLTQMPADAASDTPAHVRFHGNISTKLPHDRPDVMKTGYAAFRNHDRGRTLFGELFWNIEPYSYLALRVKSDGRRYFVNIQTDSIVESDIHQHKLLTKRHKGANGPNSPAEWETVLIRFHDFVRTNQGFITEPQSEMLRQKIKSFGIGLIDREPGAFDLSVSAMWATNLNERGQLDGRTGWQEGDQGSARLSEVTVEAMRQKAEERRAMPDWDEKVKRDTMSDYDKEKRRAT
ncbi:hypothetical protein LTR64_001052 [Lithohypha guttulata]|uniref:uncharacterized protein n=1 Tax=Lithohypha guttulata TaxID=1690604 RepID=UPI002DE1486A|nr:hypothetical protein LTR51_003246 [Lithohypha guttulata]